MSFKNEFQKNEFQRKKSLKLKKKLKSEE
jgi:hypothetical protein